MNSRWSDGDAQGKSDLDLLVYASRLIGAETTLVVWGGGNTSIKQDERDHRGRPTRVLRVKGSGSDLKSIQKKDFPGVRMDDVLALLDRQDMGDQEMVDYLAHALQEPASPRPSIETLLHGFLPASAVIHTHADAVVSLTNNDRSRDVLREVYGDEVIALSYRRPGFLISREVAARVRGAPERAGDPAREARDDLLGRHGEGRLRGHHRADQPRRGGHRPSREGARALRRRGGGEPGRGGAAAGGARGGPARARAGRREPAAGALLRRRARRARVRGLARGRRPLPDRARDPGPHHLHQAPAVLRAGRGPGGPGGGAGRGHRGGGALRDRLHRLLRGAQHRGREAHRSVPARDRGGRASGSSRPARTGAPPASWTTSTTTRSRCSAPPPRSGGYVSLSAREAFDVEYWPLELYKLSLAPPEKELARRIALVTGGASGIGRAAAQRLAAEGAHVLVGDLDAAGARKAAEEIVGAHGRGAGDRARDGRDERGLGAGRLRGGGAGLRRPRHRGLQRGHRALRAGGSHGARRLGALLRGQRHRALPGRARGHAGAQGAGARRRVRLRGHQERDVARARTSPPTRPRRRRRRSSPRCWRSRAGPTGSARTS